MKMKKWVKPEVVRRTSLISEVKPMNEDHSYPDFHYLRLKDSTTNALYGQMVFSPQHRESSIHISDMFSKGESGTGKGSTFGTLLFKHLLEWIDEQNATGEKPISLVTVTAGTRVGQEVPVGNHPFEFYRKMGFKPIEPLSEDGIRDEISRYKSIAMSAKIEDIRKALAERLKSR